MNRAVKRLKRHTLFLAAFLPLYLVFTYPLFLGQGLVKGDYLLQFYPWSLAYAEALKSNFLPLWTPLIQSGFPLFAEGQTGMLYLPNLLLFKLLPFKAAYNGLFLAHFLMGGLFAYLFARKKRMSEAAGTLVALSFAFGSAAAGGFYFINTLKVLCWFPLALTLVERFLSKRSVRPLIGLGLVLGQAWLAGYPQAAAYQVLFVLLYYLLRCRETRAPAGLSPLQDHAGFFGAIAASLLIGFPQIWATLSLGLHSTRVLHDKEFVLWGSAAPWSLGLLFMYAWNGLLKGNFYIGLLPAFLALLAGWNRKTRLWWILAAVSFLLALGRFNPLYWFALDLPVVSLLRNPSKFLFFTAFFLSMLAGFSLDRFLEKYRRADAVWLPLFFRRFCVLSAVLLALGLAASAIAHFGQAPLERFGRWYVENFVIGKSYHQAAGAEYLAGVGHMAENAKQATRFSNIFYLLPFLQIGVFVGLLWLVLRIKASPKRIASLVLALLAADLVVYGILGTRNGTSWVPNIGRFEEAAPFSGLPEGKWIELSRQGLVYPPNVNMASGHAQAGLYSPLADKHYYLLVKDLGIIDDSFGRTVMREHAFTENRKLIDFLGVQYLISDEELPGTYPIGKREGRVLSRNPQAAAEFTLLESSKIRVERLQDSPLAVEIGLVVPREGTLVRNQVYDDGWRVSVDGRHAALERVKGAFQGVRLTAGSHRVRFEYSPAYFRLGLWIHALAFAALAGALVFSGTTRSARSSKKR